MATRRASEVTAPQPLAPVVKRKRRASCLGEQERRERKRAIDREAQRSLREKTKTHIAELERTIQILRDQDRNGATASLLSEIDALRAENERLRDVIDSVKSAIGCDIIPRNNPSAQPARAEASGSGASPAASVGSQSPKQPIVSFTDVTKSSSSHISNQFGYQECAKTNRALDLDGMNVLTDVYSPMAPAPKAPQNMALEPVNESPESDEVEDLGWADTPETATWGPIMAEFFGPNWRCPSPVVLHIGNPAESQSPASVSTSRCHLWKKSNEIFGKVFSYRGAGTASNALTNPEQAEISLLYLGIKQGWNKISDECMQSPALMILRQSDDLLFKRLPKVQRLAVAYKSFKLLKYYLNSTKEQHDKIPEWLRPSLAQSSVRHPVSIDFFAWPTLRNRLLANHNIIFQTSELSRAYSQYVHFDWPFSFEDAFYYDEQAGIYAPSPIFERYHRDLKYWVVEPPFYEKFPEMMGDIEGDRSRFCELEIN